MEEISNTRPGAASRTAAEKWDRERDETMAQMRRGLQQIVNGEEIDDPMFKAYMDGLGSGAGARVGRDTTAGATGPVAAAAPAARSAGAARSDRTDPAAASAPAPAPAATGSALKRGFFNAKPAPSAPKASPQAALAPSSAGAAPADAAPRRPPPPAPDPGPSHPQAAPGRRADRPPSASKGAAMPPPARQPRGVDRAKLVEARKRAREARLHPTLQGMSPQERAAAQQEARKIMAIRSGPDSDGDDGDENEALFQHTMVQGASSPRAARRLQWAKEVLSGRDPRLASMSPAERSLVLSEAMSVLQAAPKIDAATALSALLHRDD
eukprot:tig00000042_g15492.t1